MIAPTRLVVPEHDHAMRILRLRESRDGPFL